MKGELRLGHIKAHKLVEVIEWVKNCPISVELYLTVSTLTDC